VQEHKGKSKGGSVASQLVLSQAAALTGNFRKAADVLGSVEAVQHQLGTVATLVALRERAGDLAGAEAALDAAVSWWDSHMVRH
jgi:signal recognition particle subunit SRP72